MQLPPPAVEDDRSLALPPGFRFHPTDEEIITHYLTPKILSHGAFCARAMGEVDLNKCEPWDLPRKAKMGEKEWYFFCQRDRKYPTGMRTNRATESGYWKATGKDKEICRGSRTVIVGMKKTLVFYTGRAPKGEKTDWVMHEFRLEGKVPLSFNQLPRSAKDEWVVCRVFHKNTVMLKRSPMHANGLARVNSFTNEQLDSPTLPPLMDTAYFVNSGGAGAGDDSLEFRQFLANNPAPPMASYFSFSVDQSVYPNKALLASNLPSSTSGYLHQTIQAQENPYFDMGCYLPQETPAPLQSPATLMAIRRHCKAEQFSNQSILSQDTGISTDQNTENSSTVSKHDIGSCVSYDQDLGPSSPAAAAGGCVLDLRSMWKC